MDAFARLRLLVTRAITELAHPALYMPMEVTLVAQRAALASGRRRVVEVARRGQHHITVNSLRKIASIWGSNSFRLAA